MTVRHLAVVTGKRGGFGALKPMLRTIQNDPKLRLSLIATDQHLDPRFGATVVEIEREFPVVARVPLAQKGDSAIARARAVGTCLQEMAQVLSATNPDALVLYGDRGEVLATAIAALHLGIPIAHIQGGDVSGNIDDPMRHAITKLSHLHFVSTVESAERIRAMGEETWRVHVVGDNHVDPIVAGDYTAADEVRRRFGLGLNERPAIVLFHPETPTQRDSRADMSMILEVVLARGLPTIVVYPCSDAGYEGIVEAIEAVRNRPKVQIFHNVDAPDFLGLLAIAAVLVGNSSSGVVETPYFRIPAVDIGDRQRNRLRAENVLHCSYQASEVAKALDIALRDPGFANQVAICRRPYGDGQAGGRIVDVLRRLELNRQLLDKQIVDRYIRRDRTNAPLCESQAPEHVRRLG